MFFLHLFKLQSFLNLKNLNLNNLIVYYQKKKKY